MAARVDRGPPPDPDHWMERGHQQVQGDHPQPARAAGEVAPDPVGLRPRRSPPAETRQMRRAPLLPVRRMYLPPYSPLKSLPHSVLQTRSLQIVPPTATPRAPPQGGHPWAA